MSALLSLRPALLLILLPAVACRTAPGGVTPRRQAEADEFARRAIASEQSLRADSLPARTIGVAPLAVSAADSGLAPLSYGLADLLMTDLSRSAQLRVVDRLRLDALLRELRLAESGRVDTSTAPRVGRLVGARRLVVGRLTQRPGGELGIDARIADVATTEVRPAVSARASLDDILRAEKELALRIFAQLGVNLTPAERAAVEERATQNLAALLAYSRGVRYEVEGRYDAAAREYGTALRLDPSFALAGARLAGVRPGAGPQLDRAIGTAAGRVNYPSGRVVLGGATDPAFPEQTVTIIIEVTTPP
jgi:TolB-like protein